MKILKNKLFIAGVCVLIAAVIAFVLLPKAYENEAATTYLVSAKTDIEAGETITADMLTTREVGAYGLNNEYTENKEAVIGMVAQYDLFQGELISANRVVVADDYKVETTYSVSDGNYLLTIALPSTAAGVAGVLRGENVVDVYAAREDDETGEYVANKALTNVKVVDVLNSSLESLDDIDIVLADMIDSSSSSADMIPAYVIFEVTEEQGVKIIELEKDEALHLVFVGESE